MAYDRNKVFNQCKAAITKHRLYFIEDIVAYIPCSKPTFYEFFPLDSNEFNELKDLLEQNKIAAKVEIRGKLMKGEKAAELIALYKLICTDVERRALSMQQIGVEGLPPNVNINVVSSDSANKLKEFIDGKPD